MPDVPNRSAREARLASLLRRAIGRNRQRLVEALGEPPNVDNIPESLWSDLEAEIADDSRRALAVLFLLGMNGMEFSDPLTGKLWRPDSESAGDQAADFADSRSADLASGMAGTVRNQLRTAVDQATAAGGTSRQTLASINARLREIAQTQAEAAGVTEVTSANSAGEVWYKRLYEAETGVALLGTWHTEQDDKVCRICRPLNRTSEDAWAVQFPEGPPGHVNCRCWLEWIIDPATVPEMSEN